MRTYNRQLICALLCGALLVATLPSAAPAAPAEDVEALMEGFDDTDQPTEASSDPDLEDVMSGFDEAAEPEENPSQPGAPDPAVSLDGYFKQGATWNVSHTAPDPGRTDWRGLSRLRSEAQVEVLARLSQHWRLKAGEKLFYDAAYALRGRNEFTQEVLDAYEWEAEWQEVYLQGRLGPHLDLKAGRQIMVWGRSDNLRVTDVLNPLDLREPGLTDIEDLRLPTAMTRLDGYWGQWHLSGVAVHEIRFDKRPAFGSDFFPDAMPFPPEEELSDGGDNTEWALALNGTFSGKDISFYFAELFDDTAHIAPNAEGGLNQKHARVTMWGTAGNLALGNWLLKGEAAYWRGLKFFNTPGETYERFDGLIGVEYSGWDDTTATFEWAVRHLVDFDPVLESTPDFAQEDEITNALRIIRTFSNETVEATLLGLIYGPLGQDGTLVRASVSYDWSDAINVILGMVLYQSGDRYEFHRIGDNDRIFAEFKYSF